ncbi:MAG: hypothetical protein M1160_00145 [Candidatus Marsarchaeota archaeon]|nr:hypothetical protein [Candidatus Marsarchaeota archaeon]MCL5111281.1 hypothetical protein [Candidatus Marsarchaeota archaeon]
MLALKVILLPALFLTLMLLQVSSAGELTAHPSSISSISADVGQTYTFNTLITTTNSLMTINGIWFYFPPGTNTVTVGPGANTLSTTNSIANSLVSPANELILTVNVINSNQLELTSTSPVLNGNLITGTNGALGAWAFNGEAYNTANTLDNVYTGNTAFTVDPALTGVSLTVSNPKVDVGQTETITYTWSGGTPDYSGNIIVSNAVATIANVLFTGVSGTSNTLSFTVPTGATGSYAVTANVFDSASTTVSNTLSNTLTANSVPTATVLTPATNTLDIGQNVIISTVLSGGTGPFTANLVYQNNGVVADSVTGIIAGGAVVKFTPTYTGVFTFNLVVTDTGTTTPYIFNAPGDSVINVNNALTGVSLTVSNSIVDVGQHETIAYTWSGGTPNYSGNIIVSNSVATIANVLFTGVSGTSNTLSFTVPTGATGSYTVTANVFDSASTTVSNTLTNTLVANAIPTLIITPNTTTPVYGSSVKFTIEVLNGSGPTTVTLYNVTTSTRRSMGSVIVANSGATNTIIVSPAAISTFSFRANATDSANYVFNSTVSTITSHGSGSGGGGAGGGLPVGTTVITTTTVSPATTTIVPITTTVPGTAVSSPPAPPKNYTIVGTSYNITPSNQSRTITLPYNCSLPASRLAPYIYINGTWSKIASFTVNAAACTITFTVPPDPIVAIMESPAPAVPTTTAPPSVVTTVAPTTVVSPPVTPPSNAALLYAVIVIIIAVIIIVVVGLYLRRRH